MSKNLSDCFQTLLLVSRIKDDRQRQKVLEIIGCDDKIYKALHELAINLIHGNIPLTKRQKLHLTKEKKKILPLAKKINDKRRRKRVVRQTGGFLNIVLPVVATLLTELLTQ